MGHSLEKVPARGEPRVEWKKISIIRNHVASRDRYFLVKAFHMPWLQTAQYSDGTGYVPMYRLADR